MWFIIPVVVLFISLKNFHHLSKFCASGPQEMEKEYTKLKHQIHLWSISISYFQKGNTDKVGKYLKGLTKINYLFFIYLVI